eukprot:GHVU01099815.1.p1 GENE.GHVU01099815.1~~GHVU01099815.1.p1  ORF type:complete len:102 (-),score=11.38 GHVU01099815.1:380-685(-)
MHSCARTHTSTMHSCAHTHAMQTHAHTSWYQQNWGTEYCPSSDLSNSAPTCTQALVHARMHERAPSLYLTRSPLVASASSCLMVLLQLLLVRGKLLLSSSS